MTVYLPPTNVDGINTSSLPFGSLLWTISGSGNNSDYEFVEGDFTLPDDTYFLPDRGFVTKADLDKWWRDDMYAAGGWKSAFNSALDYGLGTALQELKTVAKADAYMTKAPAADTNVAYLEAQYVTATDAESDGISELSGGVFSPLAAFAHFAFGDGTPMWVNINNLGLDLELKDFSHMQEAMDTAQPGASAVMVEGVYNTGNDSIITEYYLGHITLKLEGVINKSESGTTFDGVARSYYDNYDGNLGNFRDVLAESATEVLNALEQAGVAQPFEVQIIGELPVHFEY